MFSPHSKAFFKQDNEWRTYNTKPGLCGRELSKTKKAIESHDSEMASVKVGDRREKVGSGLPSFDDSSGLP